jgi:BlaI family transcriptional regulator, penicillinase repressor
VSESDLRNLSRRERQIMSIIYRLGHGSVSDVLSEMPDAPAYSTVRTLLGVLERKGYLRHERKSHHYEYYPTTPASEARASVLQHLLNNYFAGSVTRVVSTLIDLSQEKLDEEDYQEIIDLIEDSRKQGR